MASVKLDCFGIYPINIKGDACAWITPEDIVQGLYLLSKDMVADGTPKDGARVERAADKLSNTAWYDNFMKYKNNLMREKHDTCNIY